IMVVVMVVRYGVGMIFRFSVTALMFRGLSETGGRFRMRFSVLVGDDVSGWLVAAGAVVFNLLDLLYC
ncbi:hypothetical protein C1T30_43890, partial [Bacillus sp. MBGLi97]